jgi:ABC-type uncharacterized transport system involved in gliding motility auxiliary subunit
MQINPRTRLQLRLQSGLFVLLFIAVIGLLAWLSTRFNASLDLTANQRNSLSEASHRLLQSIDKPLTITAFVSPANELKDSLDTLFGRYHDAQALIEYHSLNPDLVPGKLREFNIQRDGEVVLEYNGRRENLMQVTETSVTNTIGRLLRQGERWVVFIEGHGERDPYGQANHDLQLFSSRLIERGFQVETLNLVQTPEIPANTDLLVIADSTTALLDGELKLLMQHVEKGGNVLWLSEGNDDNGLLALAESLELEFLPGIIVDPSTQLLGLSRVDFALAADYPQHSITDAIDSISLYPRARALIYLGADDSEWLATPLIVTQARSWNEVGELSGEIRAGDQAAELPGPMNVAFALTRSLHDESGGLQTQRVVVVGDADFLSNQYLGNGSNLDIGLNMVNWLSHDDNLISVSPKPAIDTQLDLSPTSQLVIGVLFLFLLPLSLLGAGIRIWHVRRRK